MDCSYLDDPLPDSMMPDIPLVRFVVGPQQHDYIFPTNVLFNVSDKFNEILCEEDFGPDYHMPYEHSDAFACFEQFLYHETFEPSGPDRDASVDKRLPVGKTTDCQNNRPYEDYTPVYLSYARAYVFAQRYGVKPMYEAALKNFEWLLNNVRFYPERSCDILPAVRYIYNESDPDRDAEFRSLATHFTARQFVRFSNLSKNREFIDFLTDCPDFVEDFVPVMGDLSTHATYMAVNYG